MGLKDAFSPDEEEQQEDKSDDSPSGTHLYFGERGYSKLPADVRDSKEAMSAVSEAYTHAKSAQGSGPKGMVRNLADRGWAGGIHHLLAEYVNVLADSHEQENSASPLVRYVLSDFSSDEQVEALMDYLVDNPEVGQKLADRIVEHKTEE